MDKNKNVKKLAITALIAMGLAFTLKANTYAAECESQYGGGETCLVNKRFSIEKKVRIKDSGDSFEDKITGVKAGEVVEFKIEIKNLSDDEADDFDNMEMEDFLPIELFRVGGSGLTEYWNDFDSGETNTFYLDAQIEDSEFDRENFEKCVVNKADVYWDDEFEGSDTATVCYGDVEVTELPETGATSTLAFVGFGLIIVGLGLATKRKNLILE